MSGAAAQRAGVVGAVLLLGLLVAPATAARELWSHGDFALNVSGEVRELVNVGRQTDRNRFRNRAANSIAGGDTRCLLAAEFADCPAFSVVNEKDAVQNLTRLRTKVELDAPFGLRAVVAYDHELLAGDLDTLEADIGNGFRVEDFFDAEQSIASGDDVEWQHLLYRGYLHWEHERIDLRVGRQRIAWGVGRLWNPIDRFNPVPPLAIQQDQVQGVDGIDLRLSLDGFSYLEAVYAPGTSRDAARYAARLHGVLYDTDVSLVGGVFREAPAVGFDLARNLGDAAIRAEVIWTAPDTKVFRVESSQPKELDDYWQVVVSADYNFDIGDGLYVLVEHLYNGNHLGFGGGRAGSLLPLFEATEVPPFAGAPPGPYATGGSIDLFGSSQVVTGADHQTGLQLGTDITPELRANALVLYDWDGRSAAFYPSLLWSPLDWFELTVGVQAFAGRDQSQYGDAEPVFFAYADFYF